jgi:hypothetical protein
MWRKCAFLVGPYIQVLIVIITPLDVNLRIHKAWLNWKEFRSRRRYSTGPQNHIVCFNVDHPDC